MLEKSDSLRNMKSEVFHKNKTILSDLFNTYGIPLLTNDTNDAKYQKAFWILTKYADFDVVFQERVLNAMKKELNNGSVNKDYAYLYDRVKWNKGEKQLYGTQMVFDSLGNHKLYTTRNISRLNKRRVQMSLSTIEGYLSVF